jgi:hypothetical protein
MASVRGENEFAHGEIYLYGCGSDGFGDRLGRRCVVFMAGEDLYYKMMNLLVEWVGERPSNYAPL